jgi:hypothetical protein
MEKIKLKGRGNRNQGQRNLSGSIKGRLLDDREDISGYLNETRDWSFGRLIFFRKNPTKLPKCVTSLIKLFTLQPWSGISQTLKGQSSYAFSRKRRNGSGQRLTW